MTHKPFGAVEKRKQFDKIKKWYESFQYWKKRHLVENPDAADLPLEEIETRFKELRALLDIKSVQNQYNEISDKEKNKLAHEYMKKSIANGRSEQGAATDAYYKFFANDLSFSPAFSHGFASKIFTLKIDDKGEEAKKSFIENKIGSLLSGYKQKIDREESKAEKKELQKQMHSKIK